MIFLSRTVRDLGDSLNVPATSGSGGVIGRGALRDLLARRQNRNPRSRGLPDLRDEDVLLLNALARRVIEGLD